MDEDLSADRMKSKGISNFWFNISWFISGAGALYFLIYYFKKKQKLPLH